MRSAGVKKPFNVRIPALAVCALALGIVAAYLFLRYNISLIWIIAVIPVTAIIFILLTVLTKDYKKSFLLFIAAAAFVAGMLNCYLRLNGYGSQLNEGQYYGFSATVYERGDGYVILNNAAADGEAVSGKIIVYLGETYGDFCDVGYKVKFTAEAQRCELFAYGKINYLVQDDIRYRCSVYGSLKAEYAFSLFGTIRSAIKDVLYENSDKDTAAVTYAMLTGNTYGIDESQLQSFRYGGIAHIFAVSGLHIGIIYGLIAFTCKKAKANKFVFALIAIFMVTFYAGICGFTVSSVRAVIMCTVASLSGILHKKYDGLNSLSVALFIILLISPASAFFVGFQLTACSVLGIILLSKKLSRPFKKIPRRLKEPVCVSLSAQAGSMPVMLVNFGYLSGTGIILNLILVPVLSAAFVLLFMGTLVSVIIAPAAPFIIPYAALPVQATVSFLLNAGFEKALIKGFGAGLFLPLYYLALLLLSDKLNLKFVFRVVAAATAAVVAVSYTLINTFLPFGGFKIIVSAYYGGGEVIIKSNEGNVLIVTEGLNTARLNLFMNEHYATSLDAVIILGGESCCLFYGESNLNGDRLYVYGGYLNIQPYRNVTVNYEKEFSVGGVEFEFADGYKLYASLGGAKVEISHDFVSVNGDMVDFNERNIVYNVYDCGDFVYRINNDDGHYRSSHREL